MNLRIVGTALFIGLLVASLAHPPPAALASPSRDPAFGVRADSLHRRALARIAENTIESRRLAMVDLDEAAHLAPDRAAVHRELGRMCIETGQLRRGLGCYERVVKLEPDNAGTHLSLGIGWKQEWLASTDTSSLSKAFQHSQRAAFLSPQSLEPRLALTALGLVTGNNRLGWLAAQSAIACDEVSPDALLAVGCAAYRVGALGLADSAFRAAIPRLAPEARRHFTNLASLAGEAPAVTESSAVEAAAASESFWRQHDPDFTTPENEAELNVLARVGQALLLFRDENGVRWDMRAELFARYGIPGSIELHPADAALAYQFKRVVANEYAPDPLAYPYGMQVWSYPELGMSVSLWDRSLMQKYELPIATERDPDPRPNPKVLERNPGLATLGDGRLVYRALPPGTIAMNARALVSRFPADAGARLVAHLEAPGGPTDSLWGTWVVVARDGREVARGSGKLSLSTCSPTEQRIADFGAEVPPGDYRVDLAVSDGDRRRGVVHLRTSVDPPAGQPAMSDLVLLCGTPPMMSANSVRLEPNFALHIAEVRSVAVYFEIDHLATASDGQSRFGYTYRVRPVKEGKRRPEPVLEASREEENVGSYRRQFVNAQLPSLKRGTYDLEVEVRDLVSGGVALRTIQFVKD